MAKELLFGCTTPEPTEANIHPELGGPRAELWILREMHNRWHRDCARIRENTERSAHQAPRRFARRAASLPHMDISAPAPNRCNGANRPAFSPRPATVWRSNRWPAPPSSVAVQPRLADKAPNRTRWDSESGGMLSARVAPPPSMSSGLRCCR